MTWIFLLVLFAAIYGISRALRVRVGPSARPPRRRRRIVGVAIMALATAAIFAGQMYDVSQLDAVDGNPTMDVLTGAAVDPANAKRFHVRFVLMSEPDLDRAVVEAYAVGEVTAGGGPVTFTPTWTGAESRGELRFTADVGALLRADRFSVSHGYEYENGSASSSTTVGPKDGAGYEYFGIGTMHVERRRSMFRTFDGRRVDLVYAVFILPMGEGTAVAATPYSDQWAAGEGARIREAFGRYEFDRTSMKAGASAVMSRISGFALIALFVGVLGAGLSMRHAGFGVALWALVAPFILIQSDRMAIDTFERVVTEDDRPAVRAAALRSLDDTVFFQRTARERIEARHTDEDAGIARLAHALSRTQPGFHQDIQRINVGPDELMRAVSER